MAFLVALTASVLVFGLDVAEDPGRIAIGDPRSTDPTLFMWMLAWWPHAIANGLHPVMTDAVYAGGESFNLMRTTSIPLPALLMWPVIALTSPVVAYNVLMVAAPATAAWTAFLLCRHLSGAWLPSLLGGLLFGFSPYMAGQMGGHPNLVLVALVPVVALLVVRRFEGTLSRRRFIALFALVGAAQFATGQEVFVTLALFLAVAFAAVALLMPGRRPAVPRIALESLAGGFAALVLVAPLTYYALRDGDLEHTYSAVLFSADLANLVIPTPLTSLGNELFADAAGRWTGNLGENGLYVGLPLLALALVSWRRWPALVAFFAAAVVLAFGAFLHAGGAVTGFLLPWAYINDLPYLEYALPVRFAMYAFLALAVIVALTLRPGASRGAWALVLSGLVLLVPAVETRLWARETSVPAAG